MKPTQAILRQRLDEVLAIRLDGATFFDVRRYVAEKETAGDAPWTIPDGGRPVSERTLWRYIEQTNRTIAESCRESRKRRFRLHLARRHNVYAKSIAAGDYRSALAVLRDLAEIEGMYPVKRTELTGTGGGPVILNIKEEIVGHGPSAPFQNIVEEVVTNHDSTDQSRTTDDPPTPGAAGIPQI